jgi:hypothetical protein
MKGKQADFLVEIGIALVEFNPTVVGLSCGLQQRKPRVVKGLRANKAPLYVKPVMTDSECEVL